MELSASPSGGYGGFSRDLLPCHRAIAATLGEPAPRRSLAVLQLACLPDSEVARRGGSAAVALELLHAAEKLHDQLESTLLDQHFGQPLRSFDQLPAAPPLPAAAAAAADAAADAAAPFPCRAVLAEKRRRRRRRRRWRKPPWIRCCGARVW